MTPINPIRIHEIFMDCLFKNVSDDDMCISVYTLTGIFGFVPEKIEKYSHEIHSMLQELPIEFHEGSGGGYSFLQLPFTKDGNQWGEQPNANELMALSLATGHMQYLFGKTMWGMLPGSVPYIVIPKNRVHIEPVSVKSVKSGLYSIKPIIDPPVT